MASIKVLIVEDDSDYRESGHYFLESKGFNVYLAGDGKESVEVAEMAAPDIILMDINLPIMDGYEATRIIKNKPSTAEIPIVVISAYCRDFEIRQDIIKVGAVLCLDKPLNFERRRD